ncbi:hypothetical protein SeLEV6574_g00101 [Synchytrium endobioticum]|uniref:non-specific serine/threonine protein kinase n=1 Tax=Synchytrium endobioticum TaxID=286115 RepID=A0A507DK04_9FUNG|nr:hypothetical protein SeLEV6574_g00101 [Synchytrium endobioticum]
MMDANVAAKYAARSKHLSTYSLPDIDFTDIDAIEEEELKLRPVNLNDLLRLCAQVKYETFESMLGMPALESIEKIGEATFSQVFSVPWPYGSLVDAIKIGTGPNTKPVAAVKIVPFGGDNQQTLSEIFQEMRITKEMSKVASQYGAGFVRVMKMGVVRGAMSETIIEAIRKYQRRRGKDDAKLVAAAQVRAQKYAVIVLEHAGLNLAEGQNLTWLQTTSVIGQVVLSLALAEQAVKFEHRDLHWGNLMVKQDKTEKTRRLVSPDGKTIYDIKTGGMHATVIDYTLSRLEIDGDRNQLCAVPLDDEVFFTGYGDFQFEIYRLMRGENGGDWLPFHPKTNVYWIWYLVDKLLVWKYRPYGRRSPVPISVARNRRTLELFINRIPNYESARDLLDNDPLMKKIISQIPTSEIFPNEEEVEGKKPTFVTSTKSVVSRLASRFSVFMHLD